MGENAEAFPFRRGCQGALRLHGTSTKRPPTHPCVDSRTRQLCQINIHISAVPFPIRIPRNLSLLPDKGFLLLVQLARELFIDLLIFELSLNFCDFLIERLCLSRDFLRTLLIRFLFRSNGGSPFLWSVFSTKVGVIRVGSDNLVCRQQFSEDVFVFFQNQLDEAVGAGGGVEHGAIVTIPTIGYTSAGERICILADVTAQVVVKIVAEKSQHA